MVGDDRGQHVQESANSEPVRQDPVPITRISPRAECLNIQYQDETDGRVSEK